MAKIVIAVDHKWRDLPGYVYAKVLLERKGHKVYLVRNGFEDGCAYLVGADAVVFNHVYDDSKAAILEKLKNSNILNLVMPTEGIPTLGKTQILAAGKYSDMSSVDLHFVWNEAMKEKMMEYTDLDQEKIPITGVPRFDFYCNPLKRMLLTRDQLREKYSLKNNFPIITLATNFTNAGFYQKREDFIKNDWHKLKVDKVLDPLECARRDYESRQIIMAGISKLLLEVSDINLLIKPHPSEEQDYYYSLLKNELGQFNDRVRIITQEYIWDVLNASDLLLKRSCTTGVEAWILNKPTIEARLNPDEWYCSEEHASGSDIVLNATELIDLVKFYITGGTVNETLQNARKAFLDRWCYQIDGLSTQRFVNSVDELVRKKATKSRTVISLNSIKRSLIYGILWATDYKVHDLRVYGWGSNMDKLGRFDKYFHLRDEQYWYKKIVKLLDNTEGKHV